MNLWVRSCKPVRIEARLAAQMEVVTQALVNRVPLAAKRSMFGVFKIGCPAQPRKSARWSSERMKTMLGCASAGVARIVMRPARRARLLDKGMRKSLLLEAPHFKDKRSDDLRVPRGKKLRLEFGSFAKREIDGVVEASRRGASWCYCDERLVSK